MIAALASGALTVLVLAPCRLRPDHRLRETPTPGHGRTRTRHPRPSFGRARPPGPAQIAGWCDALAREVRSGASLGAALRTVEPPSGGSLDAIAHALGRGTTVTDALSSVASATPDEQAVLSVLGACALHGGPAAQPLDRVAATLRRRAADAAERAVHSAQARLSARVMTVLPGAVLALLVATSPSVRATVASPVGAVSILVGLGLNVTGWVWMRQVIGGRRP